MYETLDGEYMGTFRLKNSITVPGSGNPNSYAGKSEDCTYELNLIEVRCSEDLHNPNQAGGCTADTKPYYILEMWKKCSNFSVAQFPNMGAYEGSGANGGGSNGEVPVDVPMEDCFNIVLENNNFPPLSPEQYTYIQNHPHTGSVLLGSMGVMFNDNQRRFTLWLIDYLRQNNTWGLSDFEGSMKIVAFSQFGQGFLMRSSDPALWGQFEDWFLTDPLDGSLQNELLEDWAEPDRVRPTTRFKNHAKLNGIYNKIKTASSFDKILKNFTPEGSVAHLIFDIGPTKKPNSDAETSEPVNYWIKIVFNQNKDWASKPKVIIAGTFMHELIHAEILRQLLAVANTNGNIDYVTLLEYAKNHKHIELFNAYVKAKTNDADFQHQYMAEKYVTTIVNFLKQVYGTQYTDVEYKTVAWMSSLKGTRAWNLLPQSEKDLYINTFNTNYWIWEL